MIVDDPEHQPVVFAVNDQFEALSGFMASAI
jgi:hypothetical protein